MRLVRIGRLVWDVLAVVDSRGRCVLDTLEDLCPESVDAREKAPARTQISSNDAAARAVIGMIALLSDRVTASGPQNLQHHQTDHLSDGIFEFRTGPKKGKKLRVLWFYATPPRRQAVICTEAFFKTDRIDQSALENAKRVREDYQRSERLNQVTVEEP